VNAGSADEAADLPSAQVSARTSPKYPQLPKLRALAAEAKGYVAGMPSESVPTCPQCGGLLKAGAMALCHREEDDRRTCRVVWGCSNNHVWWKWADRPTAELELCPYPDLMDG
jgi:hypothetical protein